MEQTEKTKKKKLNRIHGADYVFIGVLVLMCVTVIVPFLNVISISFSSQAAYLANPAMLLPKDVQLNAYRALLAGIGVWRSLGVTLLYVAAFVALRLVTSLLAGFALSRRDLKGKRLMIVYLMIPTLFSGGTVPTYLVISSLGFIDNFLVFIIPGCVAVFHILLVKTYIQGLPDAVEEAAKIDGASDIRILFSILAPMCIPVLVTIGMLTAIAKWNDWWMGFMYIQKKLYLLPIQNVVMKLTGEQSTEEMRKLDISMTDIGDSFKMASIVVVTFPIMCIYPFIQKYFEQGMNIGSVKG